MHAIHGLSAGELAVLPWREFTIYYRAMMIREESIFGRWALNLIKEADQKAIEEEREASITDEDVMAALGINPGGFGI